MPFQMPRRFINQATPALRTDRVRNAWSIHNESVAPPGRTTLRRNASIHSIV